MSESPQIGTIHYFGDYQILGEIARGGMGVVYLARQSSLNREVALKLIRSGTLASRRELELFQVEAEAAAALSHPHIVRVYESGAHEGQPFVAMDFIEGTSLARLLADGDWSFTTANSVSRQREAARLMSTLADALHHAHQRGVIHRDLKPGNILINDAGEPFVTDFGLAKQLHAPSGLTRSGQVLGTPSYMAPEQASGRSKDVTAATDVYGLGAILYALLTGQPPFAATTELETLDQVRSQEPKAPRSLNPAVDRDLATVCLKCLEKDPARRYASAPHLQEDLQRWLRGEPIQARPVSRSERVRKWAARRPVIASLSAAVAATTILGAVGVTWQWRRAQMGWGQARATNARLVLQRVEDRLTQDDSPLALALLARELRDAPENRAAEERLVHALQYRVWAIPTGDQPSPAEAETFGFNRDFQTAARQSAIGSIQADATPGDLVRVRLGPSPAVTLELRPPRPGVIRAVAFSVGANGLAAAVDGVGVCLWDLPSGHLRGVLPHPASAQALDFHPTSTLLLSGSDDSVLRLWNTDTLQLVAEAKLTGVPRCVRWRADGARFALGTVDGQLRLWSARPLAPVSEPRRVGAAIDDLRWRMSGVPGSSNQAERLFVRSETGPILSFRWSRPRGPAISQVSWPMPSLDPIESILGRTASNFHAAPILRTNVSPDGRYLVTGSLDGTACLWDTRTLEPQSEPFVHGAPVNTSQFSSDGWWLLTASADRRWRIWDVKTGAPLIDWRTTTEPLVGANFTDGGQVITSSGRVWPLHRSTGRAPARLCETAEAIAGFGLNADGVARLRTWEECVQASARLLDGELRGQPTDWIPPVGKDR